MLLGQGERSEVGEKERAGVMAQLICLNQTSAWLWNCPWQGGAHPLAAAKFAVGEGHPGDCCCTFEDVFNYSWRFGRAVCLPGATLQPHFAGWKLAAPLSVPHGGHWCPLGIKEPLGKQGPPPMLYLIPVGSEGGELDVSSSLRISPFF